MENKNRRLPVRLVVLSALVLMPIGALALTFSGAGVKINGNLNVFGSLTKGSGSFVIDDPLDPANKILYHSFVESPESKDIYDGLATLDINGEAHVALPQYFDALNGEVRYQFSALDQPMPNLYLKQEEKNNAFVIAGGVPGGTISWQLSGVRHDAYILKYPVKNEVWKGGDEPYQPGECAFKPLCQ